MVSQKMQEAAAQTFGLANVASPQLATYGTSASMVMAAGAGMPGGMGGFGGTGAGGGGMGAPPPMGVGGGFGGNVPDGSAGMPNMAGMSLGPPGAGGPGPMGNGMPGVAGGHDLRVNELAPVRAGGHDLSLAGMGRMAQHMAESPPRPAQGFPGVGDGPWAQ